MKLKKIMALILCAVLVTVGGVYATWNYAMGELQTVSVNFAVPVMADVVLTDAIGTIKVDTTNLSVSIDDADNDKHAELFITGSVKVIFTPDSDAAPDIVNNGIAMKYTIERVGDPQYNGSPMFSYTTITNTVAQTKEFEISADTLKGAITINDIVLPTFDDYKEFKALLPQSLLKITIAPSDATSTN